MRDFLSSIPLSRSSLTIIGIFVILVAIPLTVFLSQQQQEIRQRAEEHEEEPLPTPEPEEPTTPEPEPTPAPGTGGAPAPSTPSDYCGDFIATCNYEQHSSTCPSGLENVTGTGCTGHNCPGCTYVFPCSQITCVPVGSPGTAPGAVTCSSGGTVYNPSNKRYECANPRRRDSCPSDAGVGTPYVCENDGTWSNRNPSGECTTECRTDAAAPTAAPTPTTAAPTPTIAAGNTGLAFSLTLQGVTPVSSPRQSTRLVSAEVINPATNQLISAKTANATFQAGVFKGTLDLGTGFTSGSYIVKLRFDTTLKKKVQAITNITAGQVNTLAQIELVSGDININNQIEVVPDYTYVVGCLDAKRNTPGFNCPNPQPADLNDNGEVTIQDLAILIFNFNPARRTGD